MPRIRSASRAMIFAPGVPVTPTAPSCCGWSKASEPLPACVSQTGMPVDCANCGGLRIDDSSTGHDQRILRGTNAFCGTLQESLVTAIARNQPYFLGEKLFRVIERFRLDILGERDRDGSGFRGRSEDAHGFRKRGQ